MKPASESLSLPSRLACIGRARKWVRGHAEAAGFGEEETWAIELALAEALSNVIRHGYGGDPGQRIDLTIEIDADKLSISVRDYARAFDPRSIVTRDLGPPGPGGYGLHLIGELMDDVNRDTSSGNGTVLRLVKHRRKER